MQSEISERFHALAHTPESLEGLAEGALVIASEVKSNVDIDAGLVAIEELVDRVRPLVEHQNSPEESIVTLNHALFELEKFRGNKEQYDDPRNSLLDEVLTRRRGIPITLSVVYVEIARRLGFEAYGIGFPGHFLSKVVTASDIIVDPFFGRVLTLEDCADRLRAAGGADLQLDPRWLRPATTHEIYVRMLNNLKLNFLRQGDGLGALGCFDRILVLMPQAASEYRDRGLLLERMDCILPAIEDYSRFLELAPHEENAPAIRKRVDALQQRKPTLN